MGGRSGQGVGRSTSKKDSAPDSSTSQETINKLKADAAEQIAKEKTGFRMPNDSELEEAAKNVRIERGILTDEQGEYSVYFAIDTRTGEPMQSAGLVVDGTKRDFELGESAKATYEQAVITDRPTK